MTKNERAITFCVTGEFLTGLARDKLYEENNLVKAMKILMDAVSSPDISKEQQAILALRVLDGTAAFTGISGDDFGLELYKESDLEYRNGVKGLSKWNEDLLASLERIRAEKQKLEEKYAFVIDNLKLSEYKTSELNDLWLQEGHETPLFADASGYADAKTSMLAEYIEQQKSDRDDDYGWLSPEGEFHPSEWAHHREWAEDWLKKHCPDWTERYRKFPGCPKYPEPEDFMKHVMHWTLIHSPSQGLPRHTLYPGQTLTKKQKEFLIGFYEKRNMHRDSESLLKED